jgi:hypothetical protein
MCLKRRGSCARQHVVKRSSNKTFMAGEDTKIYMFMGLQGYTVCGYFVTSSFP